MMNKNNFIFQFNARNITVFGLALFFAGCTSTPSENNDADGTAFNQASDSLATTMVYVGTYAEPDQESIFLFSLNAETGALTRVLGVKAGENPSYLTLDEERKYLYAVNETGDYEGKESGAVSAFAVDQQTGDLSLLNKVASMGGAPCHISIDETGKTVLVANYMGGNIATFHIQNNGQLSQAADVAQFTGTGPNKQRQEAPHAHYVATDPENNYVLAVDLGTDKVMSYRLDAIKSTLTPNEPVTAFTAKAGAGPRHLAFHPNSYYAYLLNELNSTIDVLRYDSEKGVFSGIQTIPTIPSDYKENNQCAAVKVSTDGKFLYGSNRGHNSIVVYSIDESTGTLTLVEHVSTGGDWPRDFSLDLFGRILLVANERSNNIVTFKRDTDSGKLTATGHQAEVSKPVCVQVVPAFK